MPPLPRTDMLMLKKQEQAIRPILSVNFSPSDKLNIAAKYEFKTNLELTTKVYDNKSGGIFVDGEKVIADMPAMLAIGVDYKATDKINAFRKYELLF